MCNFVEFDYLTEEDEICTGGRLKTRNRLLVLYVFDYLRTNTNAFKRISQTALLAKMEEHPYELAVDIKTLRDTLHLLEQEGIGIHMSKAGVWYQHKGMAA